MPTELPRPWPSGPVVVSMPGGMAVFRMAGGLAAELAEALQLIQRHVGIAGEMQQRIEQHRAVAGRQHEAVAVRPIRMLRVELQELGEQDRRHVGHAHRHAGMAGGRPFPRRPWRGRGWRWPCPAAIPRIARDSWRWQRPFWVLKAGGKCGATCRPAGPGQQQKPARSRTRGLAANPSVWRLPLTFCVIAGLISPGDPADRIESACRRSRQGNTRGRPMSRAGPSDQPPGCRHGAAGRRRGGKRGPRRQGPGTAAE